ncbi:methyltransferase [Kitasatospora sp. NPDC058046]|uniref:methyltransferase n=1 Tax=Kitasatospora sp. NPDC058046 TaxID=3346312 RepID=UPI0036DDC409
MTTTPDRSGRPAELDLAPDLSTLTTRLPGQDSASPGIRRRPVRSLLADCFPALSSGQADAVTVTYGDLLVRWYPDNATYQPNLDAFRFVNAVSDLVPPKARVLDVGTGTGVLGLGIATGADVRRLCLLDYNPAALRQAQANSRTFTERNPDVVVRLVQGRFHPDLLPRLGEHDVLISNPPYFPPGLLRGAEGRTRLTDDFGLTAALITHGPVFAPNVYFMYSSAAEPEVADLLRHRPAGSRVTTVATWRAPFPSHLLTPSGRRRFSRNGPDDQWDAWHDVKVLRIEAGA